jgi:type VII secretion protein EccE
MIAPDGSPAVLPWPPRPPRRVAGIPVGLLVCWQAALLLALVAIGQPTGHVVGLGIGAAALVAVTGTRPRGRWMHEWAGLWVRYLLRTHSLSAPGQPAAELALLDLAARVEAVRDLEIEEQAVAVILHAHGATAVLELKPGEHPGSLAGLPLTVAPPCEQDAPVVSVQLLLHTVQMGSLRAWLAVQVRREAEYTSEELQGALVSAVRRLRRRLRSEGVAARPLGQDRLREALHTLTRMDLTGPSGAAAVGTEQWRIWWTRDVPQECLAVRCWSGTPDPPAAGLLAALVSADTPQTTAIAAQRLRLQVAHGALRAGDEVLAVEVMVRVAERDRVALAAAVRRLCERLGAAGAVVERLDGRQLPGLAATLPTGGFLSGYAPSADAFARPPRASRPPPAAPVEPATPVPPVILAPPPVAVPAPTPALPAVPVPVPAPVGTSTHTAPVGLASTSLPPPVPSVPAPEPRPAPVLVEVPTAPVQLSPSLPVQVATAQAYLPQAAPALAGGESAAPASARGRAQVPSPPSPGHKRAQVPGSPVPAEPARGHAPVLTDQPRPAASDMPTALPGAATPPAPPEPPPAMPDPRGAVRAYGASLLTADSARRAYLEELVALVRTPHRSPQLVSVLAGGPGLGASTTAAGLARTLATVRDDYTALLSIDTGPVNSSKLLVVCRDHAFTVVDLGAHTGEETPQALALSTRIVVVASADRRATPVTRLTLDRVSQVNPSLVAGAVIVVVCKNDRQYRRVLRELGNDPTPQALQIIPIPPDPALRAVTDVNLAKLRAPAKEAYLRLAATLASPRPVPGDGGPHVAGQPPYNASFHL